MFRLFIIIVFSILALIDFYFYKSVKQFIKERKYFRLYRIIYIVLSVCIILSLIVSSAARSYELELPSMFNKMAQAALFCWFFPKIFAVPFFLIDDILRLFRWVALKFRKRERDDSKPKISRLTFMRMVGAGVFSFFFGSFLYGVVKGAYNLMINRVPIKIKNLPDSLSGITFVLISDLHLGSFFSTRFVSDVVEEINNLKADYIFFTGDLVNNISEEAIEYIPILKRLKSNYANISILGNHDYGDYAYARDDIEGKKHNRELMLDIHHKMGFKLLLNESVLLKHKDAEFAVIGVENWSDRGRFGQYGDLSKAYKGSEGADFKLLLSHDPSHWDAQIRPEFSDIQLTLSGHTHGMQFGVQIPGFQWSPSKYIYKEWAGLYQKGDQQIYVNQGLGFLGYPGRVGIPPEITLITLEKLND